MNRTLLYLFAPLLVLNCTIALAQIPNDMLAFFSFDGHPNDTSHSFLSGIPHNAALVSGYNGQPGSAYFLNGNDAYVEIPHDTLFNTLHEKFTISLWVKQDAFQQSFVLDNNAIISKWRNTDGFIPSEGTGGYPFIFRTFNQTTSSPWEHGQIEMIRYDGSSNFGGCTTVSTVLIDSTLNDEEWHHYVFQTHSILGNIAAYIDGEYVGAVPDHTSGFSCTTYNNAPILIGTESEVSPRFFTGCIDELRIYDRELLFHEIVALSNFFTGINDISVPEVTVFPNPLIGNTLTIRSTTSNRINEILTFNSLGGLIDVNTSSSSYQVEIDLADLSEDFIILQVVTEEGISTHRIVTRLR